MSTHRDVIVVGAGHNGLVAAAYLAKAGLDVLVLERRPTIGGATVSEELFPGHRVATLADAAPRLPRRIVRDLDLLRHGLRLRPLDPLTVAPQLDARPLVVWRDDDRTVAGLAATSPADARSFPAFTAQVRELSELLAPVLGAPPPDVFGTDVLDLVPVAGVLGRARLQGRRTVHDAVRWATMSVSDVAGSWFETEALRAAVCARGVASISWGPSAAGTAAAMLLQAVGDPAGVFGPGGVVVGGMGRFTDALASAATSAGADVHTDRAVTRLLTDGDGSAAGVALADGSEIRARAVLSNADPTTTLLGLVPPGSLDPALVHDVRAIKYRGTVARVHLEVSHLPRLVGTTEGVGGGPDADALLRGWIRIAPSVRAIERAYDDAKYGEPSAEPILEVRVPSLVDDQLAPAGRHHVSVSVRYTPYHLAKGGWDERRDELGDAVTMQLDRYLPGLAEAVVDRHVVTPLDLERDYGLPEGNPNHGEHTLDQLLHLRPVPEWEQRCREAAPGLYLCGAGAHPGGGVTGIPGQLAARAALAALR